jgi:hypothetical protein
MMAYDSWVSKSDPRAWRVIKQANVYRVFQVTVYQPRSVFGVVVISMFESNAYLLWP